jgi:hypothetical protein
MGNMLLDRSTGKAKGFVAVQALLRRKLEDPGVRTIGRDLRYRHVYLGCQQVNSEIRHAACDM